MEDDDVAEGARDPERVPEGLAPAALGHDGGEDVAHEEREPGVEFLLEHDEAIARQVGEVELLALGHDVGVLLHVEPAHVREEEAARRVVRVRVRLGVLVVHAVVARPVVDRALVRDRVHEHEEAPDRRRRVERPCDTEYIKETSGAHHASTPMTRTRSSLAHLDKTVPT